MKEGLEFKGCDVDEAITAACAQMGTDRENLNIEILSTGSSGIFGLLKKKAVIMASLLDNTNDKGEDRPRDSQEKQVENSEDKPELEKDKKKDNTKNKQGRSRKPKQKGRRPRFVPRDPVPVPEEFHDYILDEMQKLLALMGLEGQATVSEEDKKTKFDLSGNCVPRLISRDGQALDGLQYLLRKITSSSLPDSASFVVDADGFRLTRQSYLEEQALKLSAEVKEKKVTRTIPPLNPAERRIVHMTLQDDKAIRSRSVGNGFFKKIIIYVPGSRRKSSRRRTKSPRK